MSQTNKKNLESFSEYGLESSECHQLLQAITDNTDQYQVKFRGKIQVIDVIFY